MDIKLITLMLTHSLSISYYNLIKTELKYVRIINPKISVDEARQIAFWITYYAKKYQLDPEVAFCMARAESHFRVDADSGVAGGILQVNYYYWDVDKHKLLNDLKYSIKEGIKVIKYTFDLVDKLSNNPDATPLYKYLLVYHGGPRRFYARRLTRRERIYIKNVYRCLDWIDYSFSNEKLNSRRWER